MRHLYDVEYDKINNIITITENVNVFTESVPMSNIFSLIDEDFIKNRSNIKNYINDNNIINSTGKVLVDLIDSTYNLLLLGLVDDYFECRVKVYHTFDTNDIDHFDNVLVKISILNQSKKDYERIMMKLKLGGN